MTESILLINENYKIAWFFIHKLIKYATKKIEVSEETRNINSLNMLV